MPLYGYECKNCECEWEVMVPLSEYGKEIKCPDCGEKLEKTLSAPYFVIH